MCTLVFESSFEAEQTANREAKGEGENRATTGSKVVGTVCSFKGPGGLVHSDCSLGSRVSLTCL